MYHIYKTKGIILSGNGAGESNRKVLMFGRETGLIRCSVQSGRSLHSKLRAGVQDYTLGNYSLIRGKNEWKLVGFEYEKNLFDKVRGNKIKTEILGSISLLLSKILEEGGDSKEIFDITLKFFESIENVDDETVRSTECLVLLKILNRLGFLRADPDLVLCIEEPHISPESIQTVSTHKSKTIKLINESLNAANINMVKKS